MPAPLQRSIIERTESMWADIRARNAEHDNWLEMHSSDGIREEELLIPYEEGGQEQRR